MHFNTKYYLLLFLFASVIGCTNRKAEKLVCKNMVSVANPTIIKNIGRTETSFYLNWNGSFENFDSILAEINCLPDDYPNEPLERKSWRFVFTHMDFYRNPLQSSNIHHPLVLLNSLGYGQCDDLATLLYFIWKKQGFNARIWGLGKHVVPEVFSDGKWKMYDPAFQVYYTNKLGQPASVQELVADNSLILSPLNKISIKEHNNLSAGIMDSLRYSMGVCKHYLSDSSHFENTSYYQTNQVSEFKIQLPKGCRIVLPVYKPTILTQPDWLDKNRDNHYYLKLEVPANTNGTIKLPLILTCVEGDIQLKSSADNNRSYNFSRGTFNQLEIIDTALTITSTTQNSCLYYKLPERFKNQIPITVTTPLNNWFNIYVTSQKNKPQHQ